MQNHVTAETALKLKKAGFPQPVPEAGQFWYGKSNAGNAEIGSLCVLIGSEKGNLRFTPVDGINNENNRFFVFAPTDTDILRELGEDYLLVSVNKNDWDLHRVIDVSFEDKAYKYVTESTPFKEGKNPAELVALAYLSIKNKP